MSTYLVALVVGNFRSISGEQDGIPIQIFATPGKEKMGAFALEATKHIVSFYDTYFGIKYPFGKLDLIALPDFDAGAMENTACITYREVLLLMGEHPSVEAQQEVASVIAHEVAHQWFGDLVTMKWWDDIWLNEGFATWITSKPIQAWKPEWHMELRDVLGTGNALAVDSSYSPNRRNTGTNSGALRRHCLRQDSRRFKNAGVVSGPPAIACWY
jgi:aminopeptidase N/puromycin-sensitive aminopeptidase